MAKQFTIGNDTLKVSVDEQGTVNDIFIPKDRSASFTPAIKHRIGVWVDGVLSWTDCEDWTAKTRRMYAAPINTTVLVNETIGILLELESFVVSGSDTFIRNIHIVNLQEQQRRVGIFVHQAFMIAAPISPDTAHYMPNDSSVLHYAGRRAFVAKGMTDMGNLCDQHSVGLFGNGLDGTWRDAENGELSDSDTACGQVDSTLRFSLTVGGLSSRRLYYWLSTASSIREAVALSRRITLPRIIKQLEQTITWWHKWLTPGFRLSERLGSHYRQDFIQSLMNIRLHCHTSGAIITEDVAAYCNPRDGAYAMWPLIRFGYLDEPLHFFAFCRSALTEDGCLMSRYGADVSVGPSQHAYLGATPPIQSDETAIVLFVFSQFYLITKQQEVLKSFYESFVVPMAEFLSQFTDENNLPKPSYTAESDTVETHTYTAAVTFAALIGAADMAEAMNDERMVVSWRTAAEEMRSAADHLLRDEDGSIYSSTTDHSASIASLFGVFMFGLFDSESDSIDHTAHAIEAKLQRPDGLFMFNEVEGSTDYRGSLWMAQYYMEKGRKDEAYRIMQKIIEQNTAEGGASVWTCAELVSGLLDTTYRT